MIYVEGMVYDPIDCDSCGATIRGFGSKVRLKVKITKNRMMLVDSTECLRCAARRPVGEQLDEKLVDKHVV